MIQPNELKLGLNIDIANGAISTTSDVWNILLASYEGKIDKVKDMVGVQPELLYAQYNYTPPIHFAVREGHIKLVEYFLNKGGYDPEYRIYPFGDSLLSMAVDRGYNEIA